MLIEGMCVGTIHVDFAKHGKADSVVGLAKNFVFLHGFPDLGCQIGCTEILIPQNLARDIVCRGLLAPEIAA